VEVCYTAQSIADRHMLTIKILDVNHNPKTMAVFDGEYQWPVVPRTGEHLLLDNGDWTVKGVVYAPLLRPDSVKVYVHVERMKQ
jgi:hypothetical protein